MKTTPLTRFEKEGKPDDMGLTWYAVYEGDQPVMQDGEHLKYKALDYEHAELIHEKYSKLKGDDLSNEIIKEINRIMDPLIELRDTLKELIKNHPNDTELGMAVRKLKID